MLMQFQLLTLEGIGFFLWALLLLPIENALFFQALLRYSQSPVLKQKSSEVKLSPLKSAAVLTLITMGLDFQQLQTDC